MNRSLIWYRKDSYKSLIVFAAFVGALEIPHIELRGLCLLILAFMCGWYWPVRINRERRRHAR